MIKPDYSIRTDSHGSQYQIMSGRELIKALADDAIQDMALGNSYCLALSIVPCLTYRAYLDDDDSALSGFWEVEHDAAN